MLTNNVGHQWMSTYKRCELQKHRRGKVGGESISPSPSLFFYGFFMALKGSLGRAVPPRASNPDPA